MGVTDRYRQNRTRHEMAADYALSLSQVYAALAYYYENKQAIDASSSERRQRAQQMKETRLGSCHEPLFG